MESFFNYIWSRAGAWLLAFCLIACQTGSICYAQDNQLVLKDYDEWIYNSDPTTKGIAVAKGFADGIYVLLDGPPRVQIWQNSILKGEFTRFEPPLINPSDICIGTNLRVYLLDLNIPGIMILNRRLEAIGMLDFASSNDLIEPLSIGVFNNGTACVLNNLDKDLWYIGTDDNNIPIGAGPGRKGILRNPSRIRADHSGNIIFVLDGENIIFFNKTGIRTNSIPAPLPNPVSIASGTSVTWFLGDGLIALDNYNNIPVFSLPKDSLQSWQIYPSADMALINESKLLLLGRDTGRLIVLEVESSKTRQP